jgi:hypothetical protein
MSHRVDLENHKLYARAGRFKSGDELRAGGKVFKVGELLVPCKNEGICGQEVFAVEVPAPEPQE